MAPTLNDKDLIIVSNIPFLFKKPQIDDIVAIKYKGKVLIKRVEEIMDDKYFVNGDNKKDSLDSRKFDHILLKDILGKLIYKL